MFTLQLLYYLVVLAAAGFFFRLGFGKFYFFLGTLANALLGVEVGVVLISFEFFVEVFEVFEVQLSLVVQAVVGIDELAFLDFLFDRRDVVFRDFCKALLFIWILLLLELA